MSERYFFDHLLGDYFGIPVQVGPSPREGYALCVFAGKRPKAERGLVLHLDLEDRTGLLDGHMHWFIQANDSERFGHAWDDNEPDQPAKPYPFEPWVLDAIQQIIAGVTAGALRELLKRVTGAREKGPDDWRSFKRALQKIYSFEQERGLEGGARLLEGWECGAALALCCLQLGEEMKGRELLEEAAGELQCDSLGDDRFRFILRETLAGREQVWSSALIGPLDEMARSGRLEAQDELTRFIAELGSEELVEPWVDLLIEHVTEPNHLATFAARLTAPALAGKSAQLVQRAIEIADENPTLLALLQGAHYAAGDLDAAEALSPKLEQEETVDDIQGKIDEYTRLNNSVSAQQARTGLVPLELRDKVARALQLERELNAYWRRRPERYRSSDCRDGRFVTGGSTLWVSMLRDARDFVAAAEHLREVFEDWELFRLRFEAHPQTVEALLNNGLGACLDCADDEHSALGIEIMRRCQAELPAPGLARLHWGFACLCVREGSIDEAIEHVREAVEGGESAAALREDGDLAPLRHDPRFSELVG